MFLRCPVVVLLEESVDEPRAKFRVIGELAVHLGVVEDVLLHGIHQLLLEGNPCILPVRMLARVLVFLILAHLVGQILK